jgi:hypothetical protein
MRQPSEFATVAKTLIESLEAELEANETKFLRVSSRLEDDREQPALDCLVAIADTHNLVLRVLGFIRVGKLIEAEKAMMDACIRRQKEREQHGNRAA